MQLFCALFVNRIAMIQFMILFLPLFSLGVITEKAHFKEYPLNQTVYSGSNLSLRCSIALTRDDNKEFHIQWRSNQGIILTPSRSNEIPGYSGRYSFSKENHEELHLNIRNVTSKDGGQFQCQLLKPGGRVFCASVFVNVLDTPRPFPPSNPRVIRKSLKSDCVPTNNSFWLRMTLIWSIVLLFLLFVVFLAVVLLRTNLCKKRTHGRYVKDEDHIANELPNIEQHHHQLQSYTNVPFFN